MGRDPSDWTEVKLRDVFFPDAGIELRFMLSDPFSISRELRNGGGFQGCYLHK